MTLKCQLRVLLLSTVAALPTMMPSVALASPTTSYPYWEWGPDWGKSNVYWSATYNAPFGWFEPYWTSSPRLTGMQRSTTRVNAYEHEIIFYDYCDTYGGCAYAQGAEAYWTTLPGATYLDPGVDNNPGEVTVEIGTADADDLQAQVYYQINVIMIGDKNYSTWSRAKIRQARGQRLVGCWTWECVFEVNGQVVVPYSDGYFTPGYKHWHY